MNESEVLHELSRRTGLPESAAESFLSAVRELVRDGQADLRLLLPLVSEDAPAASAPPNPEDPGLVEALIARAKKHPLGLEFLLSGLLASVAIALGAHAFTVEAARARLRREQAEKPEEVAVP